MMRFSASLKGMHCVCSSTLALNTGQGFKKLAKLKDAFSGASQIQVVKEMTIFNAYAQSESSPDAYESNLWGLFDMFALSGNPLTPCFQVMSMVQG